MDCPFLLLRVGGAASRWMGKRFAQRISRAAISLVIQPSRQARSVRRARQCHSPSSHMNPSLAALSSCGTCSSVRAPPER